MQAPSPLLPSDVGSVVECRLPGGAKTVTRHITRYDATQNRYYARTRVDGVERILPKDGVQVINRIGRPAFASSVPAPAGPASLLAGSGLGSVESLTTAQSATLSSPGPDGRLYRPVPVPEPVKSAILGATSVRTVARDSPIAFLARTFASHLEGGTDLVREYEASHHGIKMSVRADPGGRSPRSVTIESIEMPPDGWNRGLMTQFFNDFALPTAQMASFDVVCVKTKGSERLKEWALADWRARNVEAQRRSADMPPPEWGPLARISVHGVYPLVRRGLTAGDVALWIHDQSLLAVPTS